MSSPSLSVVVPFHRNLAQLEASLSAIRQSVPEAQLIVAADGAVDDCGPLARAMGAEVVVVPGPSGPAVARNRGTARATGDIVVFIDTDVVAAADAIPRMRDVLARDPEVAGIFGAYDYEPAARNFMSQFKNLSHTYVHEIGRTDARTFWAGLGAVRTAAFRQVGGYDERFARPSVEDIDLGYRLVTAGHALRLDTTIRGCHLKRWTLWNCVVTDIQARGVPWTQLIHRYGALANDLNTSLALRASVVAAYLAVMGAAGLLVSGWAAMLLVISLVGLVALNFDYYRWMAARRGAWFAARVVPIHLLHHLCNGVSFVAGTALYHAGRAGFVTPWTLPPGQWAPAGRGPIADR